MKRIRHFVIFLVSVVFVATLSACGGGGSSTGTGTVTITGTFNGTETLSLTLLGVSEPVGPFPLVATIGADGSFVVTDVDGMVHTGSVNGQSVQATGTDTGTYPEIPSLGTCTITATYTGTINGVTITGTVAGTFSCTDGVTTFTGVITGTFNVVQGASLQSAPVSTGGKVDLLSRTLLN